MRKYDLGLVSIGKAAQFYGVTVQTLRRWEKEGKLLPETRTLGNHRRYRLPTPEGIRVGYARVSSHDQKSDLTTQAALLQPYCDLVLQDCGSCLNCKKPRLKKLIHLLLTQHLTELHLTHEDRLLRFGKE